jgi:hypothetical protein
MIRSTRPVVLKRPAKVQPLPRRAITTDWDSARLRCWPTLSTARAEVIVAKAMCFGLLCIVSGVLRAVQVLA